MGFFRNAMNSYYFGKSGKGDFTSEDLPTTRLQLFWEMLRIRFMSLIKLNLLYMPVWIPAMLVVMIGATGISTILNQDLSGAEMKTQMMQTISMMLFALIPCIGITGPFTSGLAYVTRNWSRDEHAFIWADYKDALKANWKQSLPVSILTGLVPCVGWVCWNFYGEMASGGMGILVAAQILISILLILFAMAITFVHPMIVTYELKLKDIFKNAFLLALGYAPFALLTRLILSLPLLIGIAVYIFVSPVWAMMGVFVYYAIFGFSLSRFISASFCNAAFDKFINPRIAGAQVNRGLAHVEEDDDDDEEDEEDGDGTEERE